MALDADLQARMLQRLRLLYGQRADDVLPRIAALVEHYRPQIPPRKPTWDESDAVLITYGDIVRCPDQSPLSCLRWFLRWAGLQEALSNVHLLPFFPYSSDDGFSVIDYRQVDPDLGNWDDVAALGQDYGLMFDLVLNHVSRHSRYFEGYLQGQEPYTRFFIEAQPDEDLSQVVRPRSLPLLTAVQTPAGTRHVWTTFSEDQIDLNFAEPDVLLEMLDVLLYYLAQGARIVRLDAIAYLWKQRGTPCIHLPETHAVVKLLRDVADAAAPGTIILTETNVPHKENVSYFGAGDEAQMVYQFSLAPLLLEAMLSGNAEPLSDWLRGLEAPLPGCTYFNFTASHDGVGMRPLEGILSAQRQENLVAAVRTRGGRVSTRRNADGTDTAYELNISYFDALRGSLGDDIDADVRRFLGSQALMLALRGIPGIYFHSLVGTPNDLDGVATTGRARSINRRKYQADQLQELLCGEHFAQRKVLDGYRRLLAARIAEPAFHPDAPQTALDPGDPALVALLRESLDGKRRVLVLLNVGSELKQVDPATLAGGRFARELISGQPAADFVQLAPGQALWLAAE